jgi:hypothetical protein
VSISCNTGVRIVEDKLPKNMDEQAMNSIFNKATVVRVNKKQRKEIRSNSFSSKSDVVSRIVLTEYHTICGGLNFEPLLFLAIK